MSRTFVKPIYGFDTAPIIKIPSNRDKSDIERAILSFVDTGKKDIDQITREILVTQGYGSTKGATGRDIENALSALMRRSALNESIREDGLFIEPPAEEI